MPECVKDMYASSVIVKVNDMNSVLDNEVCPSYIFLPTWSFSKPLGDDSSLSLVHF